jgi:hypothetical protein
LEISILNHAAAHLLGSSAGANILRTFFQRGRRKPQNSRGDIPSAPCNLRQKKLSRLSVAEIRTARSVTASFFWVGHGLGRGIESTVQARGSHSTQIGLVG